MRDAALVEVAVREVTTFCGQAELAYRGFDKTGAQGAAELFFHIHAFLSSCAMVARLLWSPALKRHAQGKTLAEVLEVPDGTRIEDVPVRDMIGNYDVRLATGLALRGEVHKILDGNIGDRDAFEEEFTIFLRHYDPTVNTLTLMEQEFDLTRLQAEMADIASRAESWLRTHSVLPEHPARVSIPPSR